MAYACPAGNELRQLRTITRNWTRDQGMYEIKRHTAHKLTMSSRMLWAQMAKDDRRICRNHLGLLRYGGRFGQTMAKRVEEEEESVVEEEESEEESVVEEEESVVEEEDSEEEEETVVEEEDYSAYVATTETASESESVSEDADVDADAPGGIYPMSAPRVTISSPDITSGDEYVLVSSIELTFELNENSDDFDASSVTITVDDVEIEGALSDFTSDGTTYTSTITLDTKGTYLVIVNTDSFTSSSTGVSNLVSNTFTWTTIGVPFGGYPSGFGLTI